MRGYEIERVLTPLRRSQSRYDVVGPADSDK
jgi:hypothetical protein